MALPSKLSDFLKHMAIFNINECLELCDKIGIVDCEEFEQISEEELKKSGFRLMDIKKLKNREKRLTFKDSLVLATPPENPAIPKVHLVASADSMKKNRLIGSPEEFHGPTNTILLKGINAAPLFPYADAVMHAVKLAKDLKNAKYFGTEQKVHWEAELNATKIFISSLRKCKVTEDEAACIHFYTRDTPFYSVLNSYLRDPNREKVGPFFSYLKLFLSGMYKLPLINGTFNRGIPHEVYADKKEGDFIVMWGFTSTTDNISVLQNKQFLGDEGSRSILQFKSGMFVDIREFSNFPEDERLLLPGIVFKLKGRYSEKTGLTFLQL